VTVPFSGVGNQYAFATTAYGDGFVAVGEDLQFNGPVNGAIWYSPDGLNWMRLGQAKNDLGNAAIDLVATNGTRLVALGGVRVGDIGAGRPDETIWVSDDGSSWRRLAIEPAPFEGAFISGVVGGPSGFIAWGVGQGRAAIFHSDDGVDWAPVSTDSSFADAEVRDVKPYRGGFVAVGGHLPPDAPPSVGGPDLATAAAWWSPDGVAWEAATTEAGHRLQSVDVGAAGLLALGGGGCGGCISPKTLWHSDDGRSWRRVGDDVPDFPGYASDGARIIRFEWQSTGDVFTSTDGTAWDHVARPGRMSPYGLVVGARGLLVVDSIAKGEAPDEVDGGMRFLAAR